MQTRYKVTMALASLIAVGTAGLAQIGSAQTKAPRAQSFIWDGGEIAPPQRHDSSLDKIVSKRFDHVQAAEVLAWLAEQGFSFVIRDSELTGARVSISIHEQPLWDAVRALGDALGGHWQREGNVYVLHQGRGMEMQGFASDPFAQQYMDGDWKKYAGQWEEYAKKFGKEYKDGGPQTFTWTPATPDGHMAPMPPMPPMHAMPPMPPMGGWNDVGPSAGPRGDHSPRMFTYTGKPGDPPVAIMPGGKEYKLDSEAWQRYGEEMSKWAKRYAEEAKRNGGHMDGNMPPMPPMPPLPPMDGGHGFMAPGSDDDHVYIVKPDGDGPRTGKIRVEKHDDGTYIFRDGGGVMTTPRSDEEHRVQIEKRLHDGTPAGHVRTPGAMGGHEGNAGDRILHSLTPEQRAVSKSRGYLRASELTPEQLEMLPMGSRKGRWTIKFNVNGDSIEIRSND
jgi:hypothetical protein